MGYGFRRGMNKALTTERRAVTYLHFGSPLLIRAKTTVGAQVRIIMNIAKRRLHILLGKKYLREELSLL